MNKRTFWLATALAGTILGSGLTVSAQAPVTGETNGTAEVKARTVTGQELFIWNSSSFETTNFGDGTFTFVSGQGGMMNGNTVKGAPYSAEGITESIQTLADGNRIVRKNSTLLYRDTEGRTRKESALSSLGQWASGEEPARMVTIFDPVAGFSLSLNPRNRTATKFPVISSTLGPGGVYLSRASGQTGVKGQGASAGGTFNVYTTSSGGSGGIAIAGSPLETQVITSGGVTFAPPTKTAKNDNRPKVEHRHEDLGTQTIEGVSAKGTRQVTIYPAGFFGNERPLEVTDEKWYSEELKTVVMTKHTDPRSGESTYRLTNINRSNPDPTLFQAPAEYKVEEPKVRTTVNRIVEKPVSTSPVSPAKAP